jgi:glycosyltransferase involved in cell wall biosynthesis
MKIILVAPGYHIFPPKGWGAVESIVWDYYENLKSRNYNVVIVNEKDPNEMIKAINNADPDIVHIMYDDHIIIAPYLRCSKIFYTSHYAYLTHPLFEETQKWYFNNIFKKVIENKNIIIINAISDKIKDIYVKYGFPNERINVICNGARQDLFKYCETPKYPDKSIYIAKIEQRKAQYKYQNIENIDFVGNYHNSPFDKTNKNYLGEWDKPTLYANTTNYANLVLLSDGEADPLVVKEAFNAGLGVVLSECATANLDINKPFIDIIPNNKLNDIEYIERVIKSNRIKSVENRQDIKQYAQDTFSWKVIIDKYCELCLN